MNRSKYLIKNVGLLTLSNFSSKILVFLLVPLYTSILSTAEYGTYDLIISTVGLIYPILTLNIVDAVMRFTMDDKYDDKDVISMGYNFVGISIIITAILSMGLYIAGIWKGLVLYFLLYYISYVFNQFFIQVAKGLERVQDMAIGGVVGTLTMLVLNVVFLLVFHWGLTGFFSANILSQAMSALYFCFRLKGWQYVSLRSANHKLKAEMLFYSVPLIATTLAWWANNTLDKYAVVLLCSVTANGLLSVAYKIPSILNVFQSIFIQAWQISAIREYGEVNTKEFYGNTFSIINLMMALVCSVLILLTRPLAHILYARDFYEAWHYVPFLLISSVLNCAAGLLGPVLSAKKDTKVMMWSAIIGTATNAVLNIVLIYYVGIQGATIATVCSSLIIFLVRLKGVGDDIQIRDMYYLTWILLAIQATVEITTRNTLIEIGLCSIMFVLNWKQIKYLILCGKKFLRKR